MAIYTNSHGRTGPEIDELLEKAGTALQPKDLKHVAREAVRDVTGTYKLTHFAGTSFVLNLLGDTVLEFADEPGTLFDLTIVGGDVHAATWSPNVVFLGAMPPATLPPHAAFRAHVVSLGVPYTVLVQYLGPYTPVSNPS